MILMKTALNYIGDKIGITTWPRRSATSRARSIEELNAVATLRLVRAAERAGARRFVFFSAMGAEPPLAHALLPGEGARAGGGARRPTWRRWSSRRRSSTRPATPG